MVTRLLQPGEKRGICRVPVIVRMFGTTAAVVETHKRFSGQHVAGAEHLMREALVIGIANSDLLTSSDNLFETFVSILHGEGAVDLVPAGAVMATATHSYLLALPEMVTGDLTVFDWHFTRISRNYHDAAKNNTGRSPSSSKCA
jgi:hypothetical protein